MLRHCFTRRSQQGSRYMTASSAVLLFSNLAGRATPPPACSLQAALLELLAATARAGVVAANSPERVDVGLRQRRQRQPRSLRADGVPLAIPLGLLGKAIPARQLANRVVQRPGAN